MAKLHSPTYNWFGILINRILYWKTELDCGSTCITRFLFVRRMIMEFFFIYQSKKILCLLLSWYCFRVRNYYCVVVCLHNRLLPTLSPLLVRPLFLDVVKINYEAHVETWHGPKRINYKDNKIIASEVSYCKFKWTKRHESGETI